jgi:hypothetical protein
MVASLLLAPDRSQVSRVGEASTRGSMRAANGDVFNDGFIDNLAVMRCGVPSRDSHLSTATEN